MALAILENLQMDDNKKFEEVMKEMNLPVDTLEKMRINLIWKSRNQSSKKSLFVSKLRLQKSSETRRLIRENPSMEVNIYDLIKLNYKIYN